MSIKAAMRYHSISIRMAKYGMQTTLSAGKDVEQQTFSYVPLVMQNYIDILDNNLEVA